MFCEVCGHRLDSYDRSYVITRQFHGEFKKLLVCSDCNEQHKKELELTRQNFQMQFGDGPKVEKKTYNYSIKFNMVDGSSFETAVLEQTERMPDFIEHMVNKPYASILNGDKGLTCINLHNVTKIQVSLMDVVTCGSGSCGICVDYLDCPFDHNPDKPIAKVKYEQWEKLHKKEKEE